MNLRHAVQSVARDEEDASQRHANAGAAQGVPSKGEKDEEVYGGVFQEIDTVGKKRNRADCERYCKLNAEVGQIEDGDERNSTPQSCIVTTIFHSRIPHVEMTATRGKLPHQAPLEN